jgi:hypothetical protein
MQAMNKRSGDEIEALIEKINDFLDPLSDDDLVWVIHRANLRLVLPRGGQETPDGRSLNPYHAACDAAALTVRRRRKAWLAINPKKGRGVPQEETYDFILEEIEASPLLSQIDDCERKVFNAVNERIYDKALKGK